RPCAADINAIPTYAKQTALDIAVGPTAAANLLATCLCEEGAEPATTLVTGSTFPPAVVRSVVLRGCSRYGARRRLICLRFVPSRRSGDHRSRPVSWAGIVCIAPRQESPNIANNG